MDVNNVLDKQIKSMLESQSLTDFLNSLKQVLALMKDMYDDPELLDKHCIDIVQRIFSEVAKRELMEDQHSKDLVVYEKNDAVLFAVASYIRTSGLDERVSYRELFGFQKFMAERTCRQSDDTAFSKDFVMDAINEVQKNCNYIKAVANDTFSIVLLDDILGDFQGAFYDDSGTLVKWYLILGSEKNEQGLSNVDVFFANLGVLVAKQIQNLGKSDKLLNEFPDIMNQDRQGDRGEVFDLVSVAADYIGVGLRHKTKYSLEIWLQNKDRSDVYDFSLKLHQSVLRLIDLLLKNKESKLC